MWKFLLFAVLLIPWVITVSYEVTGNNVDGILENNDPACGKANYSKLTGTVTLQLTNLSTHLCLFFIQPEPQKNKTISHIHLLFHELLLDENDVVTIHEINGTAVSNISLIAPIHAQEGAVPVYVEGETVVIKLVGNNTNFIRKFEVRYEAVALLDTCSMQVPFAVSILHSPIYSKNATKELECSFYFLKDHSHRTIEAFTFEEYNFTESSVVMENAVPDYKIGSQKDFFRDSRSLSSPVKFHVKLHLNSSEYYKLVINYVDADCSGVKDFDETIHLVSPPSVLNNGSVMYECRWILEGSSGNVLGLKLNELNFSSVFDIVAVNDGCSKLSKPLLQITSSNANQMKNQTVRTSGQYMWVSFKPVSYKSKFSSTSTKCAQGGYFSKNGTVKLNSAHENDIILLEVDQGQVVLLNITSSMFTGSAALNIYDDFDSSNLLASLQSSVWYPVVSTSSRMMIKPVEFTSSSFSARFSGVSPGCLHMSSLKSQSYVLARNCSTTCTWIIPPQILSNSELLLDIEYLSLNKEDKVKIFQLDDKQTLLDTVLFNQSHVPLLTVPANIGALIEIDQGKCFNTSDSNESLVFVGSFSYIPGCGFALTPAPSSKFVFSSPRYPDTYPAFSSCHWKISSSKGVFLHASLYTLDLAPNHCLKVMQNELDSGSSLPADYFVKGDFTVELDAKNCSKKQMSQVLETDKGFLMNVTLADCGDILHDKADGEFSISPTGKEKTCIWKVSVPPTDGTSVNIITYTVTQIDEHKNYDLAVYDGDNVRESMIRNISGTIWSRTNTLIFIYQRLDVSQPSSILKIKYSLKSCSRAMQCDNKLCMHPDWRCNGHNECGDFSDEKHCGAVPIPPNKLEGYSAVAFWVTTLVFLFFGVLLGVFMPVCYRKYQESRYNRFQELSGIDA